MEINPLGPEVSSHGLPIGAGSQEDLAQIVRALSELKLTEPTEDENALSACGCGGWCFACYFCGFCGFCYGCGS